MLRLTSQIFSCRIRFAEAANGGLQSQQSRNAGCAHCAVAPRVEGGDKSTALLDSPERASRTKFSDEAFKKGISAPTAFAGDLSRFNSQLAQLGFPTAKFDSEKFGKTTIDFTAANATDRLTIPGAAPVDARTAPIGAPDSTAARAADAVPPATPEKTPALQGKELVDCRDKAPCQPASHSRTEVRRRSNTPGGRRGPRTNEWRRLSIERKPAREERRLLCAHVERGRTEKNRLRCGQSIEPDKAEKKLTKAHKAVTTSKRSQSKVRLASPEIVTRLQEPNSQLGVFAGGAQGNRREVAPDDASRCGSCTRSGYTH